MATTGAGGNAAEAAEAAGVTVIGLGDMGGALAETLLRRGFAVAVWNRSAGRAEPLAAAGAAVAAEAAAALAAAPVTVVCVADHAATMDLLAGAGASAAAAAAGRTLVQLSTVTSAESRALADWAARAGAGYLDGQILSYPDDVRAGRANLVCSGPRALFDRHAALLTAMAGHALHVGDEPGAAPAFDKAHLSFAVGNYLAFLHGAAMCARSGVDLRAWCDFNLRHVASGAVERELAVLADQVCDRAYDAGLDASMDVWRGAIARTVEECAAAGVPPAHLAPLATLADGAVADGRGDKELGVLFERLVAAAD